MKKRLLALFLVLALLVTCVPTGVLAEGTEGTEQELLSEPVAQEETETTNEETAETLTETLAIPEPHSHSAEQHDCEHCDETVEWIAWGDDDAEKTTLPVTTGHYYLVCDVSVSSQQRVSDSNDVVLCLNGWNADGKKAACIYRAQHTAKLTISDCTSYTDAEGNLVAGSLCNGKNKDVCGAVYATGSANVLLCNIKLTGNENTQTSTQLGYSGGAIHARSTAVVTLKNVELSNNKTSAEGGAVCLRDQAQLIAENCLFKDNEATRDGGAIYLTTKTNKLTLTGCTFENNESGKNGGAICTSAEATDITVTDCVFKSNTAGNRGGALYLDNSTVTVTGGEMTGNQAFQGGAVQCYKGNVTLSGVSITGNTVTDDGGSAIYANGGSSKVKLDSCTITGNLSTGTKTSYRGGVYMTNNSDKLTVSGATVIDDNMIGVVDGVGTKEVNILLQNSGASMKVDGLTDGAKLSVLTGAGAVETPSFLVDVTDPVTWDKTWVTYENNGLAVDYDKEKDEFFFTSTSTHIHCACGEHLYTDATCEHDAVPGCDHAEITYEPWESTNSLPKDPGNYYLTGDVVVSKETPLSTNSGISDIINLCLNGYTITVDYEKEGKINDQIFYMSVKAELTISDCTAHVDENGNYVAGKLTGGTYGVINAGVTGTNGQYTPAVKLNLYDGILTGNTANGNGGAINLMAGTSTFNMYGGRITGNSAKGNGGAVYVGEGNAFNMYGGEITGNSSAATGGGVYIHADAASVSIQGDSIITGNTVGTAASNLYLGGDVTVTVGAMGEKANVGISGDLGTLPRQVSANEAGLTGLTSDSQHRPLELIDGYVCISFTKDHAHCLCGGSDIGCDHGQVYWMAWDNASSLPTGDGYYYLVTDVTTSATAAQKTGDLHLCLNGHTVTANGTEGTNRDRAYSVSEDATLTISDCTAVYAKDGSYTAGKMTGGSYGVIFVPNQAGKNEDGTEKVNNCTVNIYDGIFTGNYNTGVGGTIAIQDNAAFNMYGGEISGNEAKPIIAEDGSASSGYGSALYLGDNALGNIFGGTITGNTSAEGACVYVYSAVLNMSGGKITGNTSPKNCAGVLLTGSATVMNMTGGEISENAATGAAGGVLLQNNATLNMQGGEISNNTANHGAGVYVSYTATFNMEGGEISNNKAAQSGGGLYLLGVTTNLKGGKISGNYAKGSGGGIYATQFVRAATETREEKIYTTELNLAGVTVSGNSTAGNGGGIVTSKGSVVNMTAGSVTGNSTPKAAGGILLQSKSQLNLKGGSISYNSAANGGGVYVSTNCAINMTGGTVSYNTSTANCAGMYLLRCNATLAGGSISNNTTKANAGGIYAAGANLKLCGTNIRDNVAEKNGGGLCTTHAKDGEARYYTTITMTGGTISGNSAVNGGGILLQTKATMTLKDGVIENNKTTKSGAGMYVSTGCTFNMEGSTIQNNEAGVNGGGIYHYKSDGTYTGGVIRNNKAAGNAGGLLATGTGNVITIKELTITDNSANNGGAIVFQGRVQGNIEGGQFTNNTATNHAGAVYVSSNTPMNITGGNFANNTSANRGGAFYLAVTSNSTVANATFTGNTAVDGGAIYAQSNLTISDCVITGNTATNNGGGISTGKLGARMFLQPQGLVATNLTVENNTAGGQGGGLYLSVGHDVDLRNSTVTGNTAGAEGGGIWAIFDTELHDLTVTGNTSGGEGYAVYLAPCEYDGESYVKGVFKIAGVMKITGNQGGDMYIGDQTTVSVAQEGLADGTEMNIKLHAGYLTQTLYGAYNYEGGNQSYVVTAGDRSITDPEYDPAYNDLFNPEEPTEEPTETPADTGENDKNNISPVVWIAGGAGAVVIAAVAAVIAVISKKKKTAAGK